MEPVRVGIIGQGRSGYDIHVHTLKQIPERFKVIAVADPIEGRCAEAVEALGCTAYADYKELVRRDDLDLIVNATPSHLHTPVTLECLEGGHDVLCEKPMAGTVSDVDAMLAKAREKGRRLAVFQQSRFAPYFQQVRKIIASGALGRIVMVKIAFNGFARRWDWQTLQEYLGGNLRNTGPHPLDQALQLFGTESMPRVLCIMDSANSFGDAEDHVKLILHDEGHPTIDLEISSCCAYASYTYQVYGTRGGLTGSTDHLEWKYYLDEQAPETELTREPLEGRAYCREELTWHTDSWDMKLPEGQKMFDVMAFAYYSNLYDVLRNDGELEAKPEHIRQQIAVMEECFRQNPIFVQRK